MGNSKVTSGIITAVSVVVTVVGYWGANRFADDLVKQNLYSDMFGAGIVLSVAFVINFIYELFND
ncbi:hypothetical protein CMI37_09320 [Candidatus Pacearchaeota archaeon]|nr:hypothetical protein [Candidatus Pacearchaeota archaeon]|tara:strand:+ start:69 stop:263 length:195 start_codon:yes stop_codon:yes gene_type:complete